MKFCALFPGQNSQALGMGRDLSVHSPAARLVLDQAEATLPGLLQVMWEGPEEELKLTVNQQPALVAAGVAAWAAWLEAGGPRPELAAGHSLGEFTALVASGALQLTDALRLVRRRGELMQEAVQQGGGAMAAVMKLDSRQIGRALEDIKGTVEIANLNSPAQTVISGEEAAVAEAAGALKALGGRVIPLKVSAPFHCSLMQPAADRLAPLLEAAEFGAGDFKVISNVTAQPHEPGQAASLLTRQVTGTVRWVETMELLAASGVNAFVEFGSGQVLTGLVGRTVEGAGAWSVTDTASLQSTLMEVSA